MRGRGLHLAASLALGCSQPIVGVDAGPADAPSRDAPAVDAPLGPTACSDLVAVLAAPAGALPDPLPVRGVLVTYVAPSVGGVRSFFFVQCAAAGPAVQVFLDPATLVPPPAPGDRIAFDVTEMSDPAAIAGRRSVAAIAAYLRDDRGIDTSPFVQDLSVGSDLAARIQDYESELVVVAGTTEGTFVPAGSGFVAAPLRTAGSTPGVPPTTYARVTIELATELGLGDGCDLTIGPSPLTRFNEQAQAVAWRREDLAFGGCR